MTEQTLNILGLLPFIDPARLDYQEWLNVGMGLKESGYTAADWDRWSSRDSGRYHPGECFKKWDTFQGTANPVTAGTIVQMAKDHGWQPQCNDVELDWNATIGSKDDFVVVDKNWIEGREVVEPAQWDPAAQLITYLETLFESTENVGYVTQTWKKDDRYLPTAGCWDRTAGQLIEQLNKCSCDIGQVIGDYTPEAGAWIRFNPLDGRGVKNENVTDYRYALVESDSMEIEKQYAIIQELALPVACLVHSGKKSLHAIVRIEASSYEEYRKRVDYLYTVCKKNGLDIDSQNRNPSRLSRMPGVSRNGKKQFLVGTCFGKASWNEWKEWVESVNDDLPEPESMESVWDNLPELSPPLIDGVLRQGHKLLIAGPSKAGKSFALIELCCSIAEGKQWLGWNCTQGKIMYVNLELDRASCLHRFKDVYKALGYEPKNLRNIDIWNLRGRSVPMDKLAPKLIRRAAKKNYIAIVIDPIYKIITGDENSADQMANFCNQFDKVCTELGAAVIYCHHHSKGSQGGKRSMDRASGSGVFARDPDALLDLIQLDISESLYEQEENKAVCNVCKTFFEKNLSNWEDDVSLDDQCSSANMIAFARERLSKSLYEDLAVDVAAARYSQKSRTAWRIEGTLREFPKFSAINLWFDYPVHHIDQIGSLKDIEPEGETQPWKKAAKSRKSKAQTNRRNKSEEFADAVSNCNMGDPPTVKDIVEWFSSTGKEISERTVRDWVSKFGYKIDRSQNNIIVKKE